MGGSFLMTSQFSNYGNSSNSKPVMTENSNSIKNVSYGKYFAITALSGTAAKLPAHAPGCLKELSHSILSYFGHIQNYL